MNETVYFVMPAYNEADNIEETIKQWYPYVEKTGLNSRLVIFNDGSKDNTHDIMMGLKERYTQFIPETKPNTGHGATIMTAYHYAINAGADYIFQTDSDGQTDPGEFWKFWEKRKEYDFIIGYRNKRQDGFTRMVVTRILKWLVWLIFGENDIDANTPFRLMKTEKLKPILEIIPDHFFLSNVIISMLVKKRKENHLRLPISFNPRQGGVSTIQLKSIIKIGLNAITDFYVLRRNLNKKTRFNEDK